MMGWYNGGAGKGIAPIEQSTRHDPLEILGERFARGEIEADEYQARAQVLRGARPNVTHKPTH